MSDTNDLLGGDFTAPSAPPHDNENGFYVVEDKNKEALASNVDNVVNAVADAVHGGKEDISKLLEELNESQKNLTKVVSAEADSSTSAPKSASAKSAEPAATGAKKTDGCSTCPYYKMACDQLSKIKIPPQVEDYVLWKNPKVTGILLASALVILISLASFSLLSVISTGALLALIATGCYRLYLGVLFRIKGTQDETFEKLNNFDVKVPKERFQEFSRCLESDVNRILVQAKAIVLWENITASALSLVGFYFIYCIGSVFNTITLVILVLVSVFTLPKVYQVYKKPIDSAIAQTTTAIHNVYKQVQDKLPFLKKKTQ